ncbi:MAG: hypothetical protein Roseis2KO_30290 [Roseivirga sp.]
MTYDVGDKVRLINSKTIGNVTIPNTSVGVVKYVDSNLKYYKVDFTEKTDVIVAEGELRSA